jgi:hypothetical protein
MSVVVDPILLKRLAVRLFSKDFNQNAEILCPSNPQEVVWAEDLKNEYGDQAPFLVDEEWDYLAGVVNKWNQDRLSNDEAFQAFSTREALFEELISKCQRIPKYEVVRARLGAEVADAFMEDTETVENLDFISCKVEEADSSQKWTKVELKDIVTMIGILALGDKDRIVADYEAFKNVKKRENHEKRERIKEINAGIKRRLETLNIWFPYPQEKTLWKTDPRTKDRGQDFCNLVAECKKKMAQERCILQHIGKRKITAKTVADLDRNMEAMTLYLQTVS